MNTKILKQKILSLMVCGQWLVVNENTTAPFPAMEYRSAENKMPAPALHPAGMQPDNWKTVKLGEVCEYGKCKTVKNSDIPNNAWVLDLEDIEKDTGKLLQRTLKPDKSTTSVRHSFKKGDVLYSKLRTYLNKVLVADMDGFCTTEIIPIDFKGKVIPQFARYVLMSPEFLDYTAQCGYGVKMPRLGTNDAKKATFPLPPLAVQQQIVAQIKTLFAEIDRIEQSRQRLLQTAKLAKQKVLAELLNNDEWGRVKLEEVGQVVTGSTPSKSNHDFYGNDYPFFKPTDLDAGINTIKASDNLSKEGFDVSRKLPKESILVCCIGSIGKTGMIQVEGTCNQQINAIIPNQNLFLPKFLFYICLTDDFQKQLWENASATTIAILNKGNFEKLLIPLLPLSVQRQIVSKIESIFAEIDKIERAVKN